MKLELDYWEKWKKHTKTKQYATKKKKKPSGSMNKSKKKSEDISSQVKIKRTFKVSMGSRKSNS